MGGKGNVRSGCEVEVFGVPAALALRHPRAGAVRADNLINPAVTELAEFVGAAMSEMANNPAQQAVVLRHLSRLVEPAPGGPGCSSCVEGLHSMI